MKPRWDIIFIPFGMEALTDNRAETYINKTIIMTPERLSIIPYPGIL